MPIQKSIRAPNGVTVNYHRLGRVEGKFPDWSVQVQSWVDRDAFLQGSPPSWAYYMPYDASALLMPLEQSALALDDLSGGTIELDESAGLDVAQVRRWAAIKTARDKLDFSPIDYGDFSVDANASSRIDILGAVVAMQAAAQTLRQWRCADNVMRELSLADLISIGTAIADRRQQLIELSDTLYQQIQNADTVAAVEAVVWPEGPLAEPVPLAS